MVLGMLVCATLVTAFALSPLSSGTYTYKLQTFSSYSELLDFLDKNYENYTGLGRFYEDVPATFFSKSGVGKSINNNDADGGSVDFSSTNIQVKGVDEPDVVKTDGRYLYIVANQKVFIVKAYPAKEAIVLAEISLDEDVYPSNIFINEDRLIVFCSSNRYPIDYSENECCWWGGLSTTVITIYDVSDRENPKVIRDIEVDGGYFDARMIDDYVYVIVNEYSYNIYHIVDGNKTINIPQITIDDATTKISADQIYYVDIPDRLDTMTHVISINIFDDEVNQKSFLLGSAQTMYVSKNNVFLTYTKYDYPYFLGRSSIRSYQEKTIVHEISISNGDISYTAQGEVPGRVLNQFSMDEHNGFFRLATTVGNVWSNDEKSSNNIYILDEELNRVSEIENIASGERIYSARFMGDKAYLVTFKKIDPFFTLDLSDPRNPKILGKLKIPGYSDYLHPYDENHIIGIGKDTVEALDSQKESRRLDFAWYQGLKIALFDVSDFKNPKEVAKIVIGDRGTDSPALYNHKAFLFDKEKELMVIPVRVCEISDEIKEQYDNYTGSMYGEFTFQGAYVYQLNLKGFQYKGRITHLKDEDILKSGYYGYWGSSSISRSLYINDVIYTISNNMVKMNNLDTLSEINSIELG
ncbi:MAG: beta-propeller domain-containing protein [Petrotogales bacterium]